MSFLLLVISTLQWNRRKAQDRFCLEGRGRGERVGVAMLLQNMLSFQKGEMTQTMYAHVNK
jgi:hypothetical protein